MEEPQQSGSAGSVTATSTLSRRKLLMGAGSSLGAAGVATILVNHPVLTQEQTGTSPATPNVLDSTPVPPEVSRYAGDWPVAQGDLQSTRAASKSPINASTIKQLKVAWTTPITASGGFGGITATPVIIDGTVYYQDMQSNVFALDAATGKEIWRRDYNVGNNGPDGVAVAYGMVFAATGDTSTAFALDAKTGKEIWSAKLSNSDFECIDMVPAVYDNIVYISTNPNNTTNGNYRGGARGILHALDAATSDIVWDNKVNAFVVAGATVVNDVVLSGSLDGFLRAYDLKTGKEVWKFRATAGLNAPPAVAGDMIVFAAGAPIFTAPEVSKEATPGGPAGVLPATPTNAGPTLKPQIFALKLGS